MRCGTFLMIAGIFFAGTAIAQVGTEPKVAPGIQLTIIPTGIRQPELLKINTGKKALMKDGAYSTVYDTVKPKEGRILLEITMDLSVEPGPLFLETSMIRLDERDRRSASFHVPIYWYLDSGPEPARADSITIANQAGLAFTFDVPADHADSLTLWICGLRVGSVPEIRERARRQSEGE
jgi:hypothetical protein